MGTVLFDTYTLKMVAEAAGVDANTVKAIDLQRLQEKYLDENGVLKKPDEHACFLGIDEFKLHNSHKYATHIINMETGHILRIAEGKKKQVSCLSSSAALFLSVASADSSCLFGAGSFVSVFVSALAS